MKQSPQKFNRKIHSQSGVTLMEVLVVVGIGSLLIGAVTTFFVNTGKEASSLMAKGEFETFTNELQQVFNNGGACLRAFSATNSSIPSLENLGPVTVPPTSVPVEIELNTGNTDPAKGPLGVPYKKGSRWGNSLTIMKFEILGKSRIGTSQQYQVPIQLTVSRRTGLKTTYETMTATATETATETGTSTSTTTTTSVTTSTIATINTASGSTTAIAGDVLTKTFILMLTLDKPNQKVIGCSGFTKSFWTATGPPPPALKLDIIYSNGGVGIDKDPATGIKLDVNGITQGNAFQYRSDARQKKNVREIPDALERVLKLRGVQFDWKYGLDNLENNGAGQIGLLAQEVEEVFPEAVITNAETGMKSVQYENLIAPLIEALKERQTILLKQQQEIDEIRKAVLRK